VRADIAGNRAARKNDSVVEWFASNSRKDPDKTRQVGGRYSGIVKGVPVWARAGIGISHFTSNL
jgi:hypothetical protein